VVLSKRPQLDIEYLGILMDSASPLVQHSPLRFRKVRQAINMAFDRRKMLLYLRNSIGVPAESGFIPAGLPVFDTTAVKGYRYDLDSARKLLAEAGFPGGAHLPVIRLLTLPAYADLASFVAKEVQETGINIQVELVQKSLLMDETAKSQVLFFRGNWIADYPDAENFLGVFYGRNPAPPNYTRFNNAVFNALYEKSLEENNDSLRKEEDNEMDRMIVAEAPIVPLWYDEALRLVSPGVQGLIPNGLNLLELRYVKKI